MARAAGVSESSVRRVWRAHGLNPRRVDTFKVSRDPRLAEKLEDIIGRYVSPTCHRILGGREEPDPGTRSHTAWAPHEKGSGETMTHDYKRHGTTTLFAALNTLAGTVLSQCRNRHTNEEWIAFLGRIERSAPKDKQVHIIADNYAAPKHANVQRKHKRFQMHYTPTSASWLNMVERFFRDITQQRIRRGVFHSFDELTTAIEEYVENHNRQPKPFIWTAKASDHLEKVTRAQQALNKFASE